MNSAHGNEVWASGAAYEPYVGRWSRLVAREFLNWMTVPSQSAWLDVGCGTGALTQTILETSTPRAIKSVDRSEGYLEYARQQVTDPRVQFQISDAQALAESDHLYDAAVSGLVLNFVPAPERMVGEMARVTRPGGTVAIYVWDYAGQMQFMRYFWDAAAALDPAGRDLDEGSRFPICQPEPLSALFRAAGLEQVQTRPIDVPTIFVSFDDYWTPFLGGQGAAPSYAMSLSDERRALVRERLRNTLPIQGDGSIHLIARAWAVRGKVSG